MSSTIGRRRDLHGCRMGLGWAAERAVAQLESHGVQSRMIVYREGETGRAARSEAAAGHRGRLILDLVKDRGAATDAAGREMQVRTFVEEVWNGKNYTAVADLYAENYVNPFGTGPAARAEPIRRYHQTFPDLHFDIEELIVAGGTVVLRAAFRGTDTGGYAGRAATGRAVEAWVVTIMHFDGDKVVREWIGADNLGLFIQLGIIDNPWPG